jgi:carbon starvation protein
MQALLDAGKIAAAKVTETRTLIFNNQLDAVVCAVFLILVTAILVDSIVLWAGLLLGTREKKVMESPFVPSQLRPEEI